MSNDLAQAPAAFTGASQAFQRTRFDWLLMESNLCVRSRASLKRAEDIEKAMGLLESKGWVQRMPEDSGAIGGRPSARYALHPALRNDDRLVIIF